MKKGDVPIYTDPDSFLTLGEDAKYPCSTDLMVYNPMLHRYSLTEKGLSAYGIDIRKYISDNSNKLQELIDKTSKKVYDYIMYKAGFSCYQIMLYRIATAPKTIYPDQYFMRKQFEGALADQARFIVENGDTARFSNKNMESEIPETPPRPEDYVKDFSDMSPECIRTLEALNLTKWFNTSGFRNPDLNKY